MIKYRITFLDNSTREIEADGFDVSAGMGMTSFYTIPEDKKGQRDAINCKTIVLRAVISSCKTIEEIKPQ